MKKLYTQHRRGTTEEWKKYGQDIIPLDGELTIEDCLGGISKIKFGDGVTKYRDLPYTTEGIGCSTNIIAAHTEGYMSSSVIKGFHPQAVDLVGNKIKMVLDSIEGIEAGMSTIIVTNDSIVENFTQTSGVIEEVYKDTSSVLIREELPEDVYTHFAGKSLPIVSVDIWDNLIVNGGLVGSFEIESSALNISPHTEGVETFATVNSHAEGVESKAIALRTHAEGNKTQAAGIDAHAEGFMTISAGARAHAEGNQTQATGDAAHSEGNNTRANGGGSHAEGGGSKATGEYSHAEGYWTEARGSFSHAEGFRTIANAFAAHAEGENTIAEIYNSHVEGSHNTTFKIKGYQVISENTSNKVLVLDNVIGINVGDIINYYDSSKEEWKNRIVEAINTEDNSIILNSAIDFINKRGYPSFPLGKTLSTGVIIINDGFIGSFDIEFEEGLWASHAEGLKNISGLYAHVEGLGNEARAIGSHAEGNNTQALRVYTHAEGFRTIANAFAAHAEGENTQALGEDSHAEGNNTKALGYCSHASGLRTIAATGSQMVNGKYNIVDNNYKYARIVGNGKSDVKRSNAYTLDWNGNGWYAGNLTIEGNVTINGNEKLRNIKNLYDGTNPGSLRTSSANADVGVNSFAEGDQSTASGQAAHAEGFQSTASGQAAHAECNQTKAIGNYSHAEGNNTTAGALGTHAEGGGSKATGEYSHAEGYWTEASGYVSHAEGMNTKATGQGSHAEGGETVASGTYSHAEGEKTVASGASSHAEGASTEANGVHAHAEGLNTKALGYCSHASGNGTIAATGPQMVNGRYNIADYSYKYARIVGNGKSDVKRSNAYTLDWNGNGWYAGNVTAGKQTTDEDSDLVLVTKGFLKSYVRNSINEILGVTAEDEGKFLKVVGGEITWVALANADEANF